MIKAKKLTNKLMAILLSASMIFSPIIQSRPVYAAEPIIEEGSTDTLTDNATTDEPVTDNNDLDTPDVDNGGSDNQGTENGDTDNSVTENGDIENPEEPDAEDGDSEDFGDAETDESQSEDLMSDESVKTVSVRAATIRGQNNVNVSDFSNVGGWNESIYAEIAGVNPEDVVDVEYSGTATGKLSAQKGNADNETALDYLVRKDGSAVRIDIPGLKAGTYTLTVTLGSNKTVLKQENIEVYAYDRSGYAHFNYTDGVGAYKDDGTLKPNAIVLYVTDKNKNDVELKVGNKTVKGIGNILNSIGQDNGNGTTSNGGTPNTNAGIIKVLAQADIPLVVRFIGTVSESNLYSKGTWSAADAGEIEGLTDYSSLNNGGAVDDNGHMARIQSGKDITLEGIGTDAVIDGWGFHYIAEGSSPQYGKSFEVRNLTFINTPEDAVGMEGQQNYNGLITSSVERGWIHNNEFYCPHIIEPAEYDKAEGDGSVDFKRGNYLTCSYNYFEGCHKTNLVGANSTSYQYNLTYHHNYYYKCDSRGPLSRNANIHMYNNIYEQQTGYAMDARASAYIFAEYNLFYAVNNPHTTSREGGGTIKSYKDSFSSVLWGNAKGNIVNDKGTYIANNCQYAAAGIQYDKFDLDSAQSYIPNGDYELQTDFMKMRAVLASQLGVQDDNPIPIAEITPDDYSMVIKSGADILQIKPPFSAAPGRIYQTTYAFNVDVPFNISVKYGSIAGILVNDAGENLLEGNGERINLPAGRYMIQSTSFYPAGTGGDIWNACDIDSIKIEAYGSGSGDDTGIVIKPGDYVLNFEGMKEVNPDNFFDVTGDYTNSMGSAIVEGKEYKDGLKMDSGANVTFNCKDGATLALIFDTANSGNTVNVDGQEYEITANGTIVLSGLPAGSHSITKGDIELALLYVVVSDGVNLYTVTLDYNDDSLRDAIKLVAAENTKYETMSELVPSAFTKGDYKLEGLYTDEKCNTKVEFPYTVTDNVTLYAHWILLEKVTLSLDCSKDLDSAVDGTETKDNMTYDTITTKKTVNGFTLHVLPDVVGSTKYYMTLKNSTTDNVRVLYTNGVLIKTDQDPMLKAIEFETSANSVLVVETALSGNPDISGNSTYKLVLAKDGAPDDSEQKHNITQGKTKVTETFEINEAGKYYLYPEGDKGLVYYSLRLIEQQYTIVFKPGSAAASGDFTRVVAKANEEITLPAYEAAEGYTFTGWSLDGTTPVDGDKYTVNPEDASADNVITITALYTETEYNPEDPSHKGIVIVGLEKEYEFTGAKIVPNIAVVDYDIEDANGIDGHKVLSPGVDYTVKYANNNKLTSDSKKDSTVTVTGKGNYAGKDTTAKFKIVAPKDTDAALEDLKGAKLSKINPVEYTGEAQYPEIELKLKNGTPTKYTYDKEDGVYRIKDGNAEGTAIGAKVTLSNNINKGTATILLTGKDINGKATSVKKTFKITAIDLSQAGSRLTVFTSPATYSVKGAVPKLTVHYKDDKVDKDLINGVDYTVKYSSNKTAGVKGKITITGKGNYTKKYTSATFDIQALAWSASDIKNPIKAVQVYDGLKAGKVKATVVDNDGNTLKPAEYDLEVYKKTDENTYKKCDKDEVLNSGDTIGVVAKAKTTTKNVMGATPRAEFSVGKNIAKAKFVLNKVNGKAFTAQYTGKEIELKATDLTVTMKDVSGKLKASPEELSDNEEYAYEIVSYSSNINKGTATAVIKGINGYSGTKTVKFKIVGKTMEIGEKDISWDDITSQFKSFMNGIFNK